MISRKSMVLLLTIFSFKLSFCIISTLGLIYGYNLTVPVELELELESLPESLEPFSGLPVKLERSTVSLDGESFLFG